MSPIDDKPRPAILFVHGTFAYDEREEVLIGSDGKPLADRWWQRRSTFYELIQKALPDYDCLPWGPGLATPRPWWELWGQAAYDTSPNSPLRTIGYTYDDVGNLLSIDDPDSSYMSPLDSLAEPVVDSRIANL